MPIPANLIAAANIFEEVMDPQDRKDYTVQWGDVLDPSGTTIGAATVTLSAEALAVGLTIVSTTVSGTDVTFWIRCDDPNNAAFDGNGITVGVLCHIEDSAQSLTREFEQTLGLMVRQR